MVKSLLDALSRLAQIVLDLLQEYDRRRREGALARKQKEADRAKSDIVGAFNSHFGGMRSNASAPDAATPGSPGDNSSKP
jgi:hypothetical protein